MWSVLEAIYDGPIDTRGYESFPVILDKLPSIADGDASAQSMPLQAGDMVVDVDGNLLPLEQGVTVFPSGCTDSSCVVTWDGSSPLSLDRLIATFRLKPGIMWSDGEPIMAKDSIFSFNIAANPDTPVIKQSSDLTEVYEAVDEQNGALDRKTGIAGERFCRFLLDPAPGASPG